MNHDAAPTAGSSPAAAQPAAPAIALSDGAKMLVFGIMALGMFMSLLDIQIVAASLPEVTSGIGAGVDEGSWIQTAYLIAEIIMIPLSAFLSRAFSTRWLFTASAAAFTLSSIACGLAWSLPVMITFRAIQGFVGGAMIPTVFATGFALFQGPKRAMIPAILGMTGTLAPILGPAFGGWITDVLSWRWLFFINVVPGLAITFLVPIFGKIDEAEPAVLKTFDGWGVPLLVMFLGGLEYVLEEGPRWNWFEDQINCIMAGISIIGAFGFMYRSFTHSHPVIDLRVFKNAQFAMGCLFQFVLGIGMFSSIYLIPQFLAQVQSYRSIDIGRAVFITGVAQVFSTPLSAIASQRFDPRHMLVFGFTLFAASMAWTSMLSTDWGGSEMFWPQALRGFAMMFCIVPATNLCMGAMPPSQLKTASGLSNLMRSLGGAVGIAGASTVINERYQLHFSRIVERLTPDNPALSATLAQLRDMVAQNIAGPLAEQKAALNMLLQMVNRQALALTYADTFVLLGVLFIAVLIVIPFSRPIPPVAGPAPSEH